MRLTVKTSFIGLGKFLEHFRSIPSPTTQGHFPVRVSAWTMNVVACYYLVKL